MLHQQKKHKDDTALKYVDSLVQGEGQVVLLLQKTEKMEGQK
jgi:hypothetical protein